MKNMKKKLSILFGCIAAVLSADESVVLEMRSGWHWHPFYPGRYAPYRYDNPWALSLYPRASEWYHGGYYDYPGERTWYGESYDPFYGYPGYYGGFGFYGRSVLIELPPRKYLPSDDLPRPLPREPGSAPLELKEAATSLQEERLRQFLSGASRTNRAERAASPYRPGG
jgi:hypothetical protein